jgi:hypothetical protein
MVTGGYIMNGKGWTYTPENQTDEIWEWEEKYKPINNPNESWETNYFDTYGKDVEIVKQYDDKFIWTWMDGDDWDFVYQGWHFANRFGYHIASVPYKEGEPNQYAWRIEGRIEFHSGEYEGLDLTTGGDYLDEDRTTELVKIGTKQGVDAMVAYIKDNKLEDCFQ